MKIELYVVEFPNVAIIYKIVDLEFIPNVGYGYLDNGKYFDVTHVFFTDTRISIILNPVIDKPLFQEILK